VRPSPFDSSPASAWAKYGGYGQLTQAGMRTCHQLGKSLRAMYAGFLDKFYSPEKVTVRSTDYDRTLMSAQAVLAGLFSPVDYQAWSSDVAWQPIPVHTVELARENLMYGQGVCPRYSRLLDEVIRGDEFMRLEQANQDLFDAVNKGIGNGNVSLATLEGLSDSLFIAVSVRALLKLCRVS